LQLFRTLLKVKNWRLNSLDATKPGYYIAMLKALAAGNYLRIAKRESSKWPRLYVTVRRGAPAKLTADTNLGAVSPGNEWVIYNEFHSDGVSKHTHYVSCQQSHPNTSLLQVHDLIIGSTQSSCQRAQFKTNWLPSSLA
jgi:hypothetical protein